MVSAGSGTEHEGLPEPDGHLVDTWCLLGQAWDTKDLPEPDGHLIDTWCLLGQA